MNKTQFRAYQMLVERWYAAMVSFDANGVSVHPNNPYEIFSLTTNPIKPDGVLGFTINPTIFNLPEKANSITPDLYILAKGWIDFDESDVENNERLRTVGFGTEAAYFRARQNSLKHVFGVHYDFSSNQKGHPIFHGQVQSYRDRAEHVIKQYPLDLADEDPFSGILKTVRMPAAQMDFFALLAQIFADHLVDKDSDDIRIGQLDTVRVASQSILGSTALLPRIAAAQCMRGSHWYP